MRELAAASFELSTVVLLHAAHNSGSNDEVITVTTYPYLWSLLQMQGVADLGYLILLHLCPHKSHELYFCLIADMRPNLPK